MSFAPPKREDIAKFNKKTLSGVVYSMKIHAESDSEWGDFTLDTEIMLAQKPNDEQTLKENSSCFRYTENNNGLFRYILGT